MSLQTNRVGALKEAITPTPWVLYYLYKILFSKYFFYHLLMKTIQLAIL